MRRVIMPGAIFVGVTVALGHIGHLNLGLPIGYFGQLNKVKSHLRNIPNVVIEGARINPDISLEDFTFDLRVDGKYDATLFFHEPPSLSWELFESTDVLHLTWEKVGEPDSSEPDRTEWSFVLAPGSGLEAELGCEIRNAHDVLANLGSIMRFVETTPLGPIDENYGGIEPKKTDKEFFVRVRTQAPGI